jgi:predicted nucleic-acid-binding Zn-ribbon protein
MKNTGTCPKCRSVNLAHGELRGAGGFLSAWLDFATRRFKTITCRDCTYTEFYSNDDHIPS